jgi:CDGSH-type Zn-finger protein
MTITITIRNNGPYVIAPDQVSQVRLVDHEGNVVPPRSAEGKPMSLCRCGASSVKPFCDGTHSKIGFVGAEAARAAFDAAQAAVKAASEGGPSVTVTQESPAITETAAPPGDPAPLSDMPGAGGPVAQGDGAEAGTIPPAPTER